MYGVFTFRSVKSFALSIPASVSGVMLVQWPPLAWTTVPWGAPVEAVGEPLPGEPERMAHPATTAMSATPRPDASRAHRRFGVPPTFPARARPTPPRCAAEPAERGRVPVAWLCLCLPDMTIVSFERVKSAG